MPPQTEWYDTKEVEMMTAVEKAERLAALVFRCRSCDVGATVLHEAARDGQPREVSGRFSGTADGPTRTTRIGRDRAGEAG